MNSPVKMIEVEQVIDRPFKDDCRANTGTRWLGKGDVQLFPEHLWPKLAVHPDVWRRVDGIAGGMSAAHAEAEAAEAEALRRAAEETEANDDLIPVLKDGAVINILPVTAEQLAAIEDDAVRQEAAVRGYVLHPRLTPDNLRLKFLEAQAIQVATQADAQAMLDAAAKNDA